MDNTIIQQGTFKSDGNAEYLAIRSDIDWMYVYNYTNVETGTGNDSVRFYWQRGMANGTGFREYLDGGGNNLNIDTLAAPSGFYLIDSSVITSTRCPAVITDITNAAPPVITSAGHGLQTGDIFRLANTAGALQLDGIDFSCTYVGANTFSPTYMPAIVAAAAPGATAYAYKVSYDSIYAPRNRTILAITQAANAVVTVSVTHTYTVGQKIRFSIPRINATYYGMTELNGQLATITAVGAGTITVDIDTTGYTAFAFPLTATPKSTPAQVIPVGADTAYAIEHPVIDELGDAIHNTAFIGMKLPGGANQPGGEANDIMYWTAGKSFSNLINLV